MVLCPLTRGVWQEIKKVYNFTTQWEGVDLKTCFQNWFNKFKDKMFLLVIDCWEIWLHKNSMLFQDKKKSIYKVVSSSISKLRDWHKGLVTIRK